MEVILIATQPIASFNVRIGDQKGTVNASLVSKNPKRYEYIVSVSLESAEPTKKITIIIFTSETTDIILFTIKACTGNLFVRDSVLLLIIFVSL